MNFKFNVMNCIDFGMTSVNRSFPQVDSFLWLLLNVVARIHIWDIHIHRLLLSENGYGEA